MGYCQEQAGARRSPVLSKRNKDGAQQESGGVAGVVRRISILGAPGGVQGPIWGSPLAVILELEHRLRARRSGSIERGYKRVSKAEGS